MTTETMTYAGLEAAAKRARRGRPPGSRNVSTRKLVDAVKLHMDVLGGDVLDALHGVIEDRTLPPETRIAAMRCAFGALAARPMRPEGAGGGA
jgi:hypothetical protein